MLSDLWLRLKTISARRRNRWRRRFLEWIQPKATKVLKSAKGETHVAEVVSGLAERLARVLPSLDRGPSVLDDRSFAAGFQHTLSWIAYQEEVTGCESKLRAYCDITASLTVFDLLVREIAKEFSLRGVDGEIKVALRLAAATGSWREPLVAAGRRMLSEGMYDEAADCARRALSVVSACPASQRLLMDALRARRSAGGTVEPVGQSANFREMHAFVQLAEEVGADAVIFQKYYSFGHEGATVFSARDVSAQTHPEHEELQAVLRDPLMQNPRVIQTFISHNTHRPTA